VLVEPSQALAARSAQQARRPWWSAQRWQGPAPEVIDARAVLPRGAQLVWANMLLHGIADPPALFARWHEALAADGFVMFSCLGPGTLRELRELYARLGWPAATPHFVDMHDLGDMLVHAGFADPVMDQEVLTLQWADAPALLAELRALGGNAAPQRMAGLRTPRWRTRLLHELEALAGPDGRLSLSFEVAYGHAFRGAPRARAGEATRVPLEDMRAMVRAGRAGPVR
jgi:malonyl-CoA O-methyltransferase